MSWTENIDPLSPKSPAISPEMPLSVRNAGLEKAFGLYGETELNLKRACQDHKSNLEKIMEGAFEDILRGCRR